MNTPLRGFLLTTTGAGCALALIAAAIHADGPAGSAPGGAGVFAVAEEPPPQPMEKVSKTSEEWRRLLTAEQYRVTRQAGTERPHGPAYKEFKAQPAGTYFCICCGAKLFESSAKFDSGCGWPSFYDPATAEGIKEKKDLTLGMVRIEVVCAKCDSHLGHVFDGEGFDTPTDRRYCINAVALRFVPRGEGEEKKADADAGPEAGTNEQGDGTGE